MTEEHEIHLQQLKVEFCDLLDTKYRAGVVEHGGKLWTKEKLIDEALMEIVDLWVYMKTRKQQEEGSWMK